MSIDISGLRACTHSSTPYKLKDFDYQHPEHLVAQTPCEERSKSRLLVKQKDGKIEDRYFSELAEVLNHSKPIILRNSTRVLNARLYGTSETGGNVEIFLLEPKQSLDFNNLNWLAIGKPFKKLKEGKSIEFSGGLKARIVKIPEKGSDSVGVSPFEIEFTRLSHDTLLHSLAQAGKVPLPPYIRREKSKSKEDQVDGDRYQTVYADQIGSVAAPTAGLHFSKDIEEQLKSTGCELVDCTLHVGAGTFMPVKDPEINQHVMHSEHYSFPERSMKSLLEAHKHGRPIMCVGTTSLRALESYCLQCDGDEERMLRDCGSFQTTNLFLKPVKQFETVRPAMTSILMTNFHQPESTLLMLVSALVGYEKMKEIYQHAITKEYRLFSYGDSSLLFL